MQDTVVIPSRFRGPPQSGNGGYVSGVFAELLPHHPGLAPEITLRSPIPLDRTMTVKKGSSETLGVDVFDDETLIAECRLIDSPFVDFICSTLSRPCPNRGSDALITRVYPKHQPAAAQPKRISPDLFLLRGRSRRRAARLPGTP